MSATHHEHGHAHDHAHHHDRHPAAAPNLLARRLLTIVLALVVVIAAGALLGVLIGSVTPTLAPKSPFGMGLREGGAATGGIAGWILDVQSQFSRAMNTALRTFATDSSAAFSLVGLAFAYGVFHAAGPGHGKAIIAAYAVASEKQIKGGILLALGAAMLQALVAIVIVGVLAVLFGATAKTMASAANAVELASFGLVALVGAVLLWRKAGATAALWSGVIAHHGHHHHDHTHHHEACGCGHDHAPLPTKVGDWKDAAATVIAAGIRPCSGAIVVMVFALSQGIFALGVAATVAMGLGTFLTTAAIAVFSIMAKRKARAMAGGAESPKAQRVSAVIETLAAAAVLCLGVALMLGAHA